MVNWPIPPLCRSERSKVFFFVLSALTAVLLGFMWVSPELGGRLIVHGGYYYILGVFGLWIFYGSRLARLSDWQKHGWKVGVFLVVVTAFAVWTDKFAHKLLFDEYVLQASAWHLHAAKEVGTPMRAYHLDGTWLAIDTFLDKRPYFFSFLISLLHDLTGFRVANVFAVNVLLTFVVLAAVYGVVRALTARVSAACLAVALLTTLPLFGQNATGGSMEMLNLAMIAMVMAAAILYLYRPEPDRLSFLVLGTVLLAQSRYESVLFVLPVALVIVFGWFRADRIFVTWPVILTPLLLVPYVWHDRYVSAKPHLWQLREGEHSRFSVEYLTGNLEGAVRFLFSPSPAQPNSLWLVLLGAAGVIWASLRVWKNRAWQARSHLPEAALVIFLFAITILANLGILMFYYWSRLDEPVTARFALPLFLLLAVVAGWLMHSLELHRIPAVRIGAVGLVAWLLIVGAPAYAKRLYTSSNLVMHELEWELGELETLRPDFLITAKATLPFMLEKIPTMNMNVVRFRAQQLAWHMQQGTFKDVLVSQTIRPTSAEGDRVVDPEDELPESFELEPLTEKRFGARWIRISRLTRIRPADADTAADDGAAGR